MRFIIDGVEIDAVENIRVGEMCEAEKELGISLADTGSAGSFALSLFVALRRQNPDKPGPVIRDEVFAADMTSIEEVKEGPPAVRDLESRRTSGQSASAKSA